MRFIARGRNVIFKQRTARHLAVREDLAWEYEHGTVLFMHGTKVEVCWLQGHHNRNDTVELKDIVAIDDQRCKHQQVGAYSGRMRLLQPIIEEGSADPEENNE